MLWTSLDAPYVIASEQLDAYHGNHNRQSSTKDQNKVG